MTTYRPTNDDIDLAGDILDAFFDTGMRSAPSTPDLDTTDDIAACQPLRDVIDAIVDKNKKLPVKASFPFERYEKFNPNKDVHAFKIMVVHKDRKEVNKAVKRFAPLFALGDCSRTFHDLATRCFATTGMNANRSTSAKINEYNGVPVSSVIGWYSDALTNQIPDVKTTNNELSIPYEQLVKKWKALVTKVETAEKAKKKFPMISVEGEGLSMKSAGGAVPSADTSTIDKQKKESKDSKDAKKSKADKKEAKPEVVTLQCPVGAQTGITSRFTSHRTDLQGGGSHFALDLSAATGTPIVATANGKVTRIRREGSQGYGNAVEITHDGKFQGFWSLYGHLSSISVSEGQVVKRGDVIGSAGNTGHSTGSHLHFEMQCNGAVFDPTGKIPMKPDGPITMIAPLNDKAYQGLQYVLIAADDPLVKETNKLLAETKTFMEEKLLMSATRLIAGKVYKLLVNDLEGKVENMTITHKPGTSVYVPLAGEPAPVVQSTGGRLVQVTVKLKMNSPIDVARLMSMFKVVGKDETVLSMLLLSRTIYKAMQSTGGTRLVYESLLEYGEEERLRKTLQAMNHEGMTARVFDEPVIIVNDILNSLGMHHFVPYSIELQTVSELAHAYEVVLTMNYSNVGARYLETFRKEKGGQQAPIIPLAARIGCSTNLVDVAGAKDAQNPEESKFNFVRAVALGAMQYGLADLVQLYVLYKVWHLKQRIDEQIAIRKQKGISSSDDPLYLPFDDIATLTVLNSTSRVSDLFGARAFEDIDSLSKTLTSKPIMKAGSLSWGSMWARIGKEAPMGGIPLGGLIASLGVMNHVGKAVKGQGKGKITAAIGGATAVGSVIWGATASAWEQNAGAFPASKAGETAGKCMNINTLAMIPFMMFELLREYLQAFYLNKTDKFIEDIVQGALNFFGASQTIARTNNPDAPARMLLFSDKILVGAGNAKDAVNGQGKETLGVIVTVYTPAIHNEVKGKVTVPFTPSDPLTMDMATGLAELRTRTRKRGEKIMQDGKAAYQANHKVTNGYEVAMAANNIQYWSMQTILRANAAAKSFGDTKTGLGNLEVAASYLYGSAGARVHAKNLIQAIITSSFIDVEAGVAITDMSEDRLKPYATRLAQLQSGKGVTESPLQVILNNTKPEAYESEMGIGFTSPRYDTGSLTRTVYPASSANPNMLQLTFRLISSTPVVNETHVLPVMNRIFIDSMKGTTPLGMHRVPVFTRWHSTKVTMDPGGSFYTVIYVGVLSDQIRTDEASSTRELIIGQLSGVLDSIYQARRATKAQEIGRELLSGMFIDESMPDVIRKGFAQAALLFLGSVEHAAHSGKTINAQSIVLNPLDRTIGRFDMSVFGYNLDLGFETKNEITTCKEILDLIDPSAMMQAAEFLRNITQMVFALVMTLSVDIVMMILEAFAPGPGWVSLVCHIGTRLYMFLQLAEGIIDLAKGKVAEKASGYAHFFILSYWFAGRLYDGVDTALLLELCYKTDIWMPAALAYNSDAYDDRDTSYLDYPIISYDTRKMPPDFYVYKIGFIEQSLEDLQDLIDTAGGQVEDRMKSSASEKEEWEDLAQKMGTRTKGMFNEQLEGIQRAIESLVFPENLSTPISINNALFQQNGQYLFQTYGSLGDLIERVILGNMTMPEGVRFCFSRMETANGSVYRRPGMTDSKISSCALLLDMRFVGKTPTLAIRTNAAPFAIIVNSKAFRTTFELDVESKIRANTSMLTSMKLKEEQIEAIIQIATILVNYCIMLRDMDLGILKEINDKMPHTLGNLMVAQALVGSGMATVGHAGVALTKRELGTIGIDTLRRTVNFRSGYLYPTVKLFFLEEHDDAWYMFDDFYGYSSIVALSVLMDRNSPVQTAIIKVTNIHGKLSNTLSDKINADMHFMRAPDGNADVNAIMLRPGCKIKLQVGNSPILTEENTIFVGRAVNVDFGEITTIEARSGGDCLLEDISRNKLVEYGYASTLSTTIADDVVENVLKRSKAMAGNMIGTGYLMPIKRIRDIAGQILMELTRRIDTISDFTPLPEANSQFTQIEAAYTDFMDMAKAAFAKHYGTEAFKDVGVDGMKIMTNKQMLENVRIRGDRYWGIQSNPKEGCWITFNETAWDNIQDLNLLLPNNVVSVRPFNTRNTLVWSEEGGYYRYRRSIDLQCVFSNQVIQKCEHYMDADVPKSSLFFEMVRAQLAHTDPVIRAAGVASLVLIAYYAQRMYMAMGYKISVDNIISPDHPTGRREGIRWFSRFGDINFDELDSFGKICREGMSKAVDGNVDLMAEQLGGVEMKTIASGLGDSTLYRFIGFCNGIGQANNKDINEKLVAKGLCTELACEMLLRYFAQVAYNSSSSHRKTCEMHLKMNGRDIIKNDIQVAKPFNTVLLSYPKANESLEGITKALTEEGLLEKSLEGSGEAPIRAHYMLHSWAMNIYRTYYRNVNVFRDCRNSTIAMVGANILNNLIRETYQGTITVLGDPYIRENDKIFIWDETRDMFGVFRVKKHTFLFSPEDGCVSVIEPEMLVRTDYMMGTTSWDSVANKVMLVASVAGVVAGAYFGARFWKMGRKALKFQSLIKDSKVLRTMDKFVDFTGIPARWATRKIVNAIDHSKAALGRNPRQWVTIEEYTKFMQAHSKEAKDIALKTLHGKANIEKIVTDSHMIEQITENMSQAMKEAGHQVPKAQWQVERMMRSAMDHANIEKEAANPKAYYDLFAEKLDDLIKAEMANSLPNRLMRKTASGFGVSTPAAAKLDARSERIKKIIDAYMHDGGTNKLNSAYQSSIEDVEKGISKLPAEYQHIARGMSDGMRLGIGSAIKLAKQAFAVYTFVGAVDFAIEEIRALGETILINQMTADNLVIAPMFFRGEPMIAGLEGMNKSFGKDVSTFDPLKARFTDLKETLIHSYTDDITQVIFDFGVEWARKSNESDASLSEQYYKLTGGQ